LDCEGQSTSLRRNGGGALGRSSPGSPSSIVTAATSSGSTGILPDAPAMGELARDRRRIGRRAVFLTMVESPIVVVCSVTERRLILIVPGNAPPNLRKEVKKEPTTLVT